MSPPAVLERGSPRPVASASWEEYRAGEPPLPLYGGPSASDVEKVREALRVAGEEEYRTAFWRFLAGRHLEHRTLSKATGAAGGYLVPTDLDTGIVRAIRSSGVLGQLASVLPTETGHTIEWPTNTVHGTASWTAENAALSESDETFGKVTLSAFKAVGALRVSEELLADAAYPLSDFLTVEFGERIGVLEETAFIAGDGSGKPQGILANITAVQAPAGNTTTFRYQDLLDVVHAVPLGYRRGGYAPDDRGILRHLPSASWIVSDSAAKAMQLINDAGGNPAWMGDVPPDQPPRLLGYPVYVHPDMPAVGASNKSAMFGNWRKAYQVRRVLGFALDRRVELYAENGQVGFRGVERVDGRVLIADAARSLQHSAT